MPIQADCYLLLNLYFKNDEEEQDRLDMLHHIYRLILGGPLWCAPITSSGGSGPSRILDLGTGTGIWCIHVADELPESLVEGTVGYP